jgi:CDP-diacylglycerol--glycerol-3-phosphate 3-phosphatidyltransferase
MPSWSAPTGSISSRECRESELTESKPSNLNVPNALTTLRILLVPVFGWALLQDGGDSSTWRWIACGIFAVAMITDKIDGDLARKHNLVTDFGKIADPIADKAITGMAFIGLSIVGDIWWWVTIVVLLREWSVTLLRLSVLKHVVIAAARSGQIKTVLQSLALTILIAPLPHGDAHGGAFDGLGTVGEVVYYVGLVALAAAVAMTLWSGYEFYREVWRQRRTSTA